MQSQGDNKNFIQSVSCTINQHFVTQASVHFLIMFNRFTLRLRKSYLLILRKFLWR